MLDPAQHPPDAWAHQLLESCGSRLVFPLSADLSEKTALCSQARVIMTGATPVDETLIETMQECHAIIRLGTGYDNIDVQAAGRRGIRVANIPDFCTDEVADHTIAMILALDRKLLAGDALVREGKWEPFHLMPAASLRGRLLGLAGYGKIARAVAARARAFGMGILYYDPAVSEIDGPQPTDTRACFSLEELMSQADIVSLHLPLTPQTRRLINYSLLSQMQPHALLINCARGEIIVETDLIAALLQKLIAGAALDVFAQEPPEANNPLLTFPQVLLSPHCAAHTAQALEHLRRQAYEEAARVLRGEEMHHIVNTQWLEARTAVGSMA